MSPVSYTHLYPASRQHGGWPRFLRPDRFHGPHARRRPVCRFFLRPGPCGDDGPHRYGQQPHGWRHCCLRCGGVRGAEIRVANPHEYWICSEKELPAGRLFFALGLCLKGAEITVCTPFVPICFKAFFVPHQESLLAD